MTADREASLRALEGEIRMFALVIGQSAIEGPEPDEARETAIADTMREWADRLAALTVRPRHYDCPVHWHLESDGRCSCAALLVASREEPPQALTGKVVHTATVINTAMLAVPRDGCDLSQAAIDAMNAERWQEACSYWIQHIHRLFSTGKASAGASGAGQPLSDEERWNASKPFFTACSGCKTATHCAHWGRCLSECVPKDLGLIPASGAGQQEPSEGSPVGERS